VGAIVLALGAAVIVPMLLESEPRPLGEDVSVKIPPVDQGKFVYRLNDPAAKTDKAAAGRAPEAKDAPRPADPARTPESAKSGEAVKSSDAVKSADAGKSDDGSKSTDGNKSSDGARSADPAKSGDVSKSSDAAKSKYDTRLTDKEPAAAEPKSAPAKNDAAGGSSAAAPTAVASESAASPATRPATAPAASAPTSGAFAVQLAAFSDDKGANALASRLKRSGYSAYTEPLKTSKGTLWRVRVGPYASREAATSARDKLKGEGQNGIVAPAH